MEQQAKSIEQPAHLTTAHLATHGYTDGVEVASIQMNKNGIDVGAYHPIKMDPDLNKCVRWDRDNFHHHGSQVQRTSLYTPAMEEKEMKHEAPLTVDVRLTLYTTKAMEEQTIAYLKKNYARLSRQRATELKSLAADILFNLGDMGL